MCNYMFEIRRLVLLLRFHAELLKKKMNDCLKQIQLLVIHNFIL